MKEIYYYGGKLLSITTDVPAEEVEKILEFMTDFLIRPRDRFNTPLIKTFVKREFP